MDFIFRFRKIYLALVGVLAVPFAIYLFASYSYVSKCSAPRKSCLEHRQVGCSINGNYNIKFAWNVSEVTCDMQTDGGGWMLLANYLHKKATPGGPTPLGRGLFPLENHRSLGSDEVGTRAWGHISLATHVDLSYKELRFRCETTAHSRLVDFSLFSEKCLAYFKTGKGACTEGPASTAMLRAESRALSNSNSMLPGVADRGWADQGDNALTNYPFFADYKSHWSIGSVPSRFECDDYDAGAGASTFHQVWAR